MEMRFEEGFSIVSTYLEGVGWVVQRTTFFSNDRSWCKFLVKSASKRGNFRRKCCQITHAFFFNLHLNHTKQLVRWVNIPPPSMMLAFAIIYCRWLLATNAWIHDRNLCPDRFSRTTFFPPILTFFFTEKQTGSKQLVSTSDLLFSLSLTRKD